MPRRIWRGTPTTTRISREEANLATRATATGALGDIMVVEMVAAVAEELDEEQAEAEAEAGPSW